MRKNSVFWAFFARRSAKSVRKKCFFHVFWDTLSKFAKKAFFFARRYAKSVSVLSRFSRHFVQSSQKSKKKKNVFWVFSATFPKNCEGNSVFHVFRDTLYKVCKKCFKNSVFLRDVMQRVWENSVLSRFSRHFVQSSQKMLKNSVFEHFGRGSAKSVRKLSFFSFFLRRSAKSIRKQCFFTFFETLCTKFAKKV